MLAVLSINVEEVRGVQSVLDWPPSRLSSLQAVAALYGDPLEIIAQFVAADVVVVGQLNNKVIVLWAVPNHGLAPPMKPP